MNAATDKLKKERAAKEAKKQTKAAKEQARIASSREVGINSARLAKQSMAETVTDMKKNGINSAFMKVEYPTEKIAMELTGMTRKQILDYEIKEMESMVKRGY